MSSGPAFVFNDVDSFINASTQMLYHCSWKTFYAKATLSDRHGSKQRTGYAITVPTTIHRPGVVQAIRELQTIERFFP